MSYANLHDRILENEWFMGLSDGVARTFLHLIAYASREDGHILSKDISHICRRIGRNPISFRRLLALSEGRIIETPTGFYIRDWPQWNKERDISKDRVRAYRERKRVTSNTCNMLPVTPVTSSLRLEEEEEKSKHSIACVTPVTSPLHEQPSPASQQASPRIVNPEFQKLAEEFRPDSTVSIQFRVKPDDLQTWPEMALLIEGFEEIRSTSPNLLPSDRLTHKQKTAITNNILAFKIGPERRTLTVDEVLAQIRNSDYLCSSKCDWFGLHKLAKKEHLLALMMGDWSETFGESTAPGETPDKPADRECPACHELIPFHEYLNHVAVTCEA